MAKENGTDARKDLQPILAAAAKVREAEAALEDARAAMNAAGRNFLLKHGKTTPRKLGKGSDAPVVDGLTYHPVNGGDGYVYEVLQRFSSPDESSFTVRIRPLA